MTFRNLAPFALVALLAAIGGLVVQAIVAPTNGGWGIYEIGGFLLAAVVMIVGVYVAEAKDRAAKRARDE